MNRQQLVEAYFIEKQIESTRRYLVDGRRFGQFSQEILEALWIGNLQDLVATGFNQDLQWAEIADLECEFGLRRIDLPTHQVEPELVLLESHLEQRRRDGQPDPRGCAEVHAELADLSARLSRPKH